METQDPQSNSSWMGVLHQKDSLKALLLIPESLLCALSVDLCVCVGESFKTRESGVLRT